MKLTLIVIFVVVLVSLMLGTAVAMPPSPDGGGPIIIMNRDRRSHSTPPSSFPKCQEFMDAVELKMRENMAAGEGGHQNCKEATNPHECRFEDMLRARNQISDVPSQECRDQVFSFFDSTITTISTSR